MWIFTVAANFFGIASEILGELSWEEERKSINVLFTETIRIFLESETLSLEKMTPKKKNQVETLYGDLREPLTEIFLKHTEKVRKFERGLEFMFVPENKFFSTLFFIMLRQDIKEKCLEIFFSLLDEEYQKSQSFQKIEAVSMDAFSSITNEKGFNDLVSFFFSRLKEKFKNLKAPESEKNGKKKEFFLLFFFF